MVLPDTLEEWRDVAMKFQIRWNFPHACGAIDGKHVAVKQPRKSGTMFLQRFLFRRTSCPCRCRVQISMG